MLHVLVDGFPSRGEVDDFADGVIQEVDAGDNAIWQWTMSDHFDPASAPFPQDFRWPPRGEEENTVWDVFHINALDREADGDYVVTVRHMDGVFRVDYPSGDVLWTLGTPPSTDAGASQLTIVGDPFGGPKRPHDARLNGNVLTMLDNQAGTGRPSRAVAYTIDVAAGTATMLWEIRNIQVGGATLGSVQRADDGSVLINWGAGLQPIIDERTPDGTRLMAVGLPNSGNSYRTVKYTPEAFDVGQLRATAGGSLTPPP